MNQCPKCHSSKVTQVGLDLLCLSCGLREPLYDYPMSWGCHRALSVLNCQADPGPEIVHKPERQETKPKTQVAFKPVRQILMELPKAPQPAAKGVIDL